VKHAVLYITKGLSYKAADDFLIEKRGVLGDCI
jgi:hypothetical protein